MPNFFSKGLLEWNRTMNDRSMPWKGEKDPYRIWISEVILQQTRVGQGWAYYERFISRFPDIHALATAQDDEVFKFWEGLGYYSRCRNLLFSARFIHQELNGKFPETHEGISALKGIGPYTAAAIASFAYGLPHAVLDGNVIRVISRLFGIDAPFDVPSGRRLFTERADELLDRQYPAEYNQAIMDFGATICKPRSPLCTQCPFQSNCKAFALGLTDQLPVKAKKIGKKKRYLHYLILEYNGSVYLRKRMDKDIWQHLFEFFLLEHDRLLDAGEILEVDEIQSIIREARPAVVQVSPILRQVLSHQALEGRFFHIRLASPPLLSAEYRSTTPASLQEFAFPRFIRSYLEENLYIQ